MSGWTAKRAWKEVTVDRIGSGYQVLLDARPVHTPAKARLVLPSAAMANAIAEEWRAVDKLIDPRWMPVTRAANAAIDKVGPQFAEVADLVAAYGASDLLCYRAGEPSELTEAQARAWDPMLDWAVQRFGAHFTTTSGVVPVAQPAESVVSLTRKVHACTNFQLTALHDLVSLSGSLVLGLAATTSDFSLEQLWALSRFDEDWQSRQWGVDEEASAITEAKQKDFLRAGTFWKYSTVGDE